MLKPMVGEYVACQQYDYELPKGRQGQCLRRARYFSDKGAFCSRHAAEVFSVYVLKEYVREGLLYRQDWRVK